MLFGGSSYGDTGTDLSLLSMSSVAGLFVWALADTHSLRNSVWQIEAMFQIPQKKQRRVLIFLLLLVICCFIPLTNVKKNIYIVNRKVTAAGWQSTQCHFPSYSLLSLSFWFNGHVPQTLTATTLDKYEKIAMMLLPTQRDCRRNLVPSIFHTATLSNAPESQFRVTAVFIASPALTLAWR